MSKLLPLTRPEVDRLRDVYSSGPLTTTERYAATDAALAAKGWVCQYDDMEGTVVPSRAAYGLPEQDTDRSAQCMLYGDDGMVLERWRVQEGPASPAAAS